MRWVHIWVNDGTMIRMDFERVFHVTSGRAPFSLQPESRLWAINENGVGVGREMGCFRRKNFIICEPKKNVARRLLDFGLLETRHLTRRPVASCYRNWATPERKANLSSRN
jgi:hypothetical protein